MDPEIFDIVLKAGGSLAASVGKKTVLSVFRHVILNQPDHVIERFFSTLSSAEQYNDEKLKHDTLRGDWYFDNDNDPKFVENMVRQIISDTQGKKSEYITKFYVNIRLSSNDDIEEHTAFSYMKIMDDLSWRQLCMIRLIQLRKQGRLNRCDEMTNEKIGILPDDQRTTFYAIGREYQELMDKQYIWGASVSLRNMEPFLDRAPGFANVPPRIERLSDLMNLHEIKEKEISEIFSIWNITTLET